MKITDIEIFVVSGGRRPWLFSAVRTDEGITGYGEFGRGAIANSLIGFVEDFKPLIIEKIRERWKKYILTYTGIFGMYRVESHRWVLLQLN